MKPNNPIETLLTAKQTCILQILSGGDELTCNDIIELSHISRSGFYSTIKKLLASGLITKNSIGRARIYQINKIGLLLSKIAKAVSSSAELSTSDLTYIAGKLEEVLSVMHKVGPVIKEIERLDIKQDLSIFERLKLRKLRKEREHILQEVDVSWGLEDAE